MTVGSIILPSVGRSLVAHYSLIGSSSGHHPLSTRSLFAPERLLVDTMRYMGGAKKAVVGAVSKGPANSEVWIVVGFRRIPLEIIAFYAQNADFQH